MKNRTQSHMAWFDFGAVHIQSGQRTKIVWINKNLKRSDRNQVLFKWHKQRQSVLVTQQQRQQH